MTRLATELDRRFCDPNAGPTDWATTTAILRGAHLSWITAVLVDGPPHVTPLVTVWLDRAIRFSTGPDDRRRFQ